MSDAKQLVDKLWNYCDILRDDGLSYGDYVEQLTFLCLLPDMLQHGLSQNIRQYLTLKPGRGKTSWNYTDDIHFFIL